MTDVDETQRAVEEHLTDHAPLRRPASEMARPESVGNVLRRLAPRARWRREDADAMREAGETGAKEGEKR